MVFYRFSSLFSISNLFSSIFCLIGPTLIKTIFSLSFLWIGLAWSEVRHTLSLSLINWTGLHVPCFSWFRGKCSTFIITPYWFNCWDHFFSTYLFLRYMSEVTCPLLLDLSIVAFVVVDQYLLFSHLDSPQISDHILCIWNTSSCLHLYLSLNIIFTYYYLCHFSSNFLSIGLLLLLSNLLIFLKSPLYPPLKSPLLKICLNWGLPLYGWLICKLSVFFSLMEILLAVTTTCLISFLAERIQYSLGRRMFLSIKNFRLTTSLECCYLCSVCNITMYGFWILIKLKLPPCIEQLFSGVTRFGILLSELNLQTFESTTIGLSGSGHSLASQTNVKQTLWTLTPSWNACVSIQSFVLCRWASACSFVLPTT